MSDVVVIALTISVFAGLVGWFKFCFEIVAGRYDMVYLGAILAISLPTAVLIIVLRRFVL